ncbi:uncharacterized protein LOC143239909 isoform X2 [Tachypleus tridentatus]|uniref:uncharacterized protein LOC143239909 isoform X2 n=1 Tax=Tachypleus tridentatus TaxID=6853 RepID=UPI003FD04FF2
MSETINFNIESICSLLNELKNEKKKLGDDLQHHMTQRKALEDDIGKAREKFCEVSNYHIKVQETLKIAKFKADQMQSQAKILKTTNQELREKIEELQNHLRENKEQYCMSVAELEDQLNQLSSFFVNAVTYYTDAGLQNEIFKTDNQVEGGKKQIFDTKDEINKVVQEIKSFTLEPRPDEWEQQLPIEQRMMVLEIFQEEHHLVKTMLEKLQREKLNLQVEREQFMVEK